MPRSASYPGLNPLALSYPQAATSPGAPAAPLAASGFTEGRRDRVGQASRAKPSSKGGRPAKGRPRNKRAATGAGAASLAAAAAVPLEAGGDGTEQEGTRAVGAASPEARAAARVS